MPLPGSGPISFADLNTANGVVASTQIDLDTAAIVYGIPTKPHGMDEFYGRGRCVSYSVENPDANYDVYVSYLPCDAAGVTSEYYVTDASVGPGYTVGFSAQEGTISAGGGIITTLN